MKEIPVSRILTIAFAGLGVLAVTYMLYGRLFEGDIREYQISPDGQNIAEARAYHEGGATSTDLLTVEVRTRFNPFRHTVLAGLDYGPDLSIRWADAKNLIVRCTKCNTFDVACSSCGSPLYVTLKESKWRDITIHYETQ